MKHTLADTLVDQPIQVHRYDTVRFPFQRIFSEFCQEKLGCASLEHLHTAVPEPHRLRQLVKEVEDQKTYLHGVLYQIDPAYQKDAQAARSPKNTGFIATYQAFVQSIRERFVHEPLVYQKLPTLRIHLPGNLSVGNYHRDGNYGHPKEEINIWVPLTRAYETASIRIETAHGKGDHQPVNIGYGQYVIFHSSLEHGNAVNAEGYARVSFDFRIIPFSRYRESEAKSWARHMKFTIHDYYDVLGEPMRQEA